MRSCLLLSLNGQFDRARVCPLSDYSGQSRILARDGLSAFDPKRTLGLSTQYGLNGLKRPRYFGLTCGLFCTDDSAQSD